ncbi:hypothetical protein ES288_D11G181100v1 [Gossypium darwinii]|uniref:Secreted protein n=1 Tax=Gossypium darwinii TaxID=34276 RepID=A0A5D2AL34_GOSDA|nr:hypothetical protein ES288_D11G181100v1 [Gossypium darwinii]
MPQILVFFFWFDVGMRCSMESNANDEAFTFKANNNSIADTVQQSFINTYHLIHCNKIIMKLPKFVYRKRTGSVLFFKKLVS